MGASPHSGCTFANTIYLCHVPNPLYNLPPTPYRNCGTGLVKCHKLVANPQR